MLLELIVPFLPVAVSFFLNWALDACAKAGEPSFLDEALLTLVLLRSTKLLSIALFF